MNRSERDVFLRSLVVGIALFLFFVVVLIGNIRQTRTLQNEKKRTRFLRRDISLTIAKVEVLSVGVVGRNDDDVGVASNRSVASSLSVLAEDDGEDIGERRM